MSLLKALFTPFTSQPKPFTTSSATQIVVSAIVAPLSSSPPTSTSSLSPNFDFSVPIVYVSVAEDVANHYQGSATNMGLLLPPEHTTYLPLVRTTDDLIKAKQDCTPQTYSQAQDYEDDETESLSDILDLFPMPPSAHQDGLDDQAYANEPKIDEPQVNLDDLLRLFSTPLPESEDLEQDQDQEADDLLDIISRFPMPPTHTFPVPPTHTFSPPIAKTGPQLSRTPRTTACRPKLDENGILISKPRRQTRRRALAPLN